MKTLQTVFICFFLFSFNWNSGNLEVLENQSDDFAEFLKMIPEKKLPINLTLKELQGRCAHLAIDANGTGFYWERIPLLREPMRKVFYDLSPPINRRKQNLIKKFIGPSPFIRMHPQVTPIYKFQPSEEKYAVIYAYDASSFRKVFIRIFDKKGNEIDTLQIGSWGYKNIVSSISSNHIIEKRGYKKSWDHPAKKQNVEDIWFLKQNINEVEYYTIDQTGKFKLIQDYCGTNGV